MIENNNMDENLKQNNLIKISVYSSMFLIILLIIGFSLAFFTMSEEQRLRIRGNIQNTFEINLVTPQGAYINASNIEPILSGNINTQALRTNFSVETGNNHHNVNYDLSMKDIEITNNLRTTEFKWRLLRDNTIVTTGTFASVENNQLIILSNESIAPNTTHQYEFLMWIESQGQPQNHLLNGTFRGRFSIEAYMGRNVAQDQILENNILKTGADFTVIADNSNTATQEGLFQTVDEHGIAYVFRGTHQGLNNNVIFAGHQWKILRIEGNGNIRMIYNGVKRLAGTTAALPAGWGSAYCYGTEFIHNGTEFQLSGTINCGVYSAAMVNRFTLRQTTANATSGTLMQMMSRTSNTVGTAITTTVANPPLAINGNTAAAATSIGTVAFNSHAHINTYGFNSSDATRDMDNRFVGFMHGNQQGVCTSFNSCHTNQVNSSIKTTLETWLNNTANISQANRSLIANNTVFCSDRSIRAGNSGTGIGMTITTYASSSRVSGTGIPTLICPRSEDLIIGPIGLITHDEANLAGGRVGLENENFFLRTNQWSLTMSPDNFRPTTGATIGTINNGGNLALNTSVSGMHGVRPVISLRSDVEFSSGDGSSTNPFRVQ